MNIRLSRIKLRLPVSRRLLFEIDQLEIPFGSKILVQGPSGKGKTTLLHLIAGLLAPDDGSVHIGERRLASLSEEEISELRRQHFGIVFQKLNLLDHLTGLENVLLALPRKDTSLEIAKNALERVNVSSLANERCAALSLGEQQRIAVARVLAARPDIVLADEPTSSLDGANATAVIDNLLAASEGKTLVVVSHDDRIQNRFSTILDFAQWVPA